MKIRKTLVILAAAVALGISGCGETGTGTVGDEGIVEDDTGIVEE